MVQDGWMSLRLLWRINEDSLQLLSEPWLSEFKNDAASNTTLTLCPKLSFSYNSVTRQTTIFTTGVNEMHLCTIEHFKGLSATSLQPEGIVAQLPLQYFVVAQESFVTSID